MRMGSVRAVRGDLASPARSGRPAGAEVRLREAVLDVVFERGYRATGAREVCERAGVGPEEFARHFPGGLEEAFLAIFEEECAALLLRCEAALAGHRDWAEGLAVLAGELAGWVHRSPREARLTVVESLVAGERVRLRREAVLAAFAALVDSGRLALADPDAVSPAAAEAVVGATLATLARRLASRRPVSEAEAGSAIPALLYFALRPYLGHERAARALEVTRARVSAAPAYRPRLASR